MAYRRLARTSDGRIARAAREARGWNREQLAVAVPCSVGLIARFETEPWYTPGPQKLARICQLVGVDVADLLGVDVEVEPKAATA